MNLSEYLEKRVKELNIAGAAICVMGPNGIEYAGGFGTRDKDEEIRPDIDTVFGIASMSKSITAMCVSILAAEGKLSWADPVRKYFPNFRLPGIPDDAVTLRHLAMHTAGIQPMEPLEWSISMNTPDRTSDWDVAMQKSAPNKMETIDQIVDYISGCNYPSIGEPGEYMSYSNEGYALLSYVADMAAGIPLERFMKERVFDPIGMTRSVLDLDASEAIKYAGGNITDLFDVEDGKLKGDRQWSILPPFRGCACVKSTARDMAAYYRCIANMGKVDGKQAIPEAAVEMMIGKAFPAERIPYYCLGLNKRVIDGHVIAEHNGGLHGVSTNGCAVLGEGYGIAALTNTSDGDVDELAWAAWNSIWGKPFDRKNRWLAPIGREYSDPDMLEGSFTAHEGIPCTYRVRIEDGALCAECDGEKYLLKYCGDQWFQGFQNGEVQRRMRIYVKNGKAWALKVGSRIYMRSE